MPGRPIGFGASGLTFRALTLGILASGASAVLYPFLIQVHNIHGMGFGYFTWLSVLILFAMIFGINVALKLVNPVWAFRPQELVVIFVMALVAVIADASLALYLVAVLATPHYYASPENEWAKLLLDHIPDWIAPTPAGNVIAWFYNGLPKGVAIPWAAWIPPLLWWGSFIGAFFLVCIALVAVFRKQWVEHERLLFPLMHPPMALMEDSASRRLLPAVTRKPSFLAGFTLIFGLLAWNVATFFEPTLPLVRFGGLVNIGRDLPPLVIAATPWVIGLCYFVSPQVLFSFWFFQLLVRFEEAFFNRVGYSIGPADASSSYYASLGWQTWGAFGVFILYGIWAGRRHLADIFRRAWRGMEMESPERELMSPRLAVLCVLAGSLYMVAFMARTGMSAPMILLFAPASILAYFGTTRLVIEGGLPYMRSPITPQAFTMHMLGSAGTSGPAMVGFAFSYGWIADMWSIFMPATAHGAKLADWLGMNGRVIVIASIIGLAVAFAVTMWYHVELGYHFGAHNFGTGQYQGLNTRAFDYVANKMRNPHGPDFERLGFLGLGAVMMSFLIMMHHRFAWWPLHPIGFTSPVVVGTIGHFGSFFLTWLAKVVLIGVGGQSLYERGKPFFIGLVAGHITGTALYVLADVFFFPDTSHPLVRYF